MSSAPALILVEHFAPRRLGLFFQRRDGVEPAAGHDQRNKKQRRRSEGSAQAARLNGKMHGSTSCSKPPQLCGLSCLSGFWVWIETAFCVAAPPVFCYASAMTNPNPDPDENDPIELWGTRIGRGLGFLITIGIILALIVWLGAAKP
jgi:hypothetical protein